MSTSPAKAPRIATPVAVVGAGALFPGSADKVGFWRDILAGKDLVTEVPPTHWLIDDYFDPDPSATDKIYAKRGAFLQAVDFNPMEFAIPPTNLPSTDTAQLLALLVAKQVLEDAAGTQFATMDRNRMSVVLGVASATELVTELSARMQRPVWADALRKHGFDEAQVQAICERIANQYVPWTENSFPGMLGNVVAGRIANRFDLAGTNCVIDAACASSLAALHLSLLELESGHSDLVITGGVDALNDVLMYTCFSKTPALSPTGDCRPFSAAADGTILGEGLGMLALKRLDDAERDGDRIYAVIRGLGTSSDGQSKSIYAPVAEGQAKALRRTYDAAGYGPETVELLEAHGTGTRAGDLAEFQGMARVFGDADGEAKRWCALGSVKSQIGHTKAAAGSAGLFKAVMALHHKVLPPTIKVDEPNPALNLADSPFYLNTRARPWVRGSDHPRRASVSSFGFGGSNYHVALEEYTGAAPRRPRLRTHDHELLMVGAGSASELIERCRALDLREAAAAFTAHESLQAWQGGTHRLALVVTPCDAAATMAVALERIGRQPQQPFALPGGAVHYGVGAALGSLGLVFSGQGSQYLEMGRDLAMGFDAARAVWDRSADLAIGTTPLHEVVFPLPVFSDEDRASQERTLTATEWAQPGIGAVQLSQLAMLRQVGVTASAVAGHSFGEFTALAAAGALSEGDLLRVARRRGELMAAAATTPGAMTAVMGGPQDLEQQVRARGFEVVAANRNAPSQMVFSGALAAIEQLERWLASSSLEFRRLPVSTAFHSPLVQSAVEPLAQFLATIDLRPPTVPVYANTTAQPYPAAADAIRWQLAAQLAAPVRFSDQVENMYAAGVRVFLEVGPRAALSGFVEQTIGTRPCVVVSLDRAGTDGVLGLCQALAKLAAAGVSMRPAELWRDHTAPLDPKLHKKPALAVPILGSNYGRPYPPPPGTDTSPARPQPIPASVTATTPSAAAQQAAEMEVQQWMAQLKADAQATQAAEAVQMPAVLPVVQTVAPTPDNPALRNALLAVVSEKTGYPVDMLDLSLELEAGLGIASIKRVEILSAFRERMPSLPEVAPSQLASLNTLGEVLAFMQPGDAVGATAAEVLQAQAAPAAAPSGDVDALRAVLLSVVAEKTGYPVDMLDLSLELEAGLGIDSIKRVEILSSFRERMPGLPEVAPSQLASLNTLADVLGFMRASQPNGELAPVMSVPLALDAPPASDAVNADANALRDTLLAVVSEKTGYPADMLDLSLELEAGLGIDSIKRVEILSAFRERMPGLPEVAPSQLAALNTLGDVLAFMQVDAPAAEAATVIASPPAAIETAAPTADSAALRDTLLAVVSEKTGYPADMLDLSLELEAGLGIDSIKRVEILSAFRERMPGLPEVAPSQLAALNTLADVLAFMQSQSPAPVAAAITDIADTGSFVGGLPRLPELTAMASAGTAARRAASVALPRHVVRSVAQPAAGFAMPGLLQRGASIAVTDDGRGIGRRLVQVLEARGVAARLVSEPSATAGCTGLIVLAGLQAVGDAWDAIRANRRAFEFVQAMSPRLSDRDGLLVTVQDTGGDFGLSGRAGVRAYLGGIAALARTAANEWPQAAVKAIDIDATGRAPAALAKALAAELLQGGAEREVGLPARGARLTLATEVCSTPVGRCVIDAQSVVVATGGARGVTALCLKEIAHLKPRIAILGRTHLDAEPPAVRAASTDADVKRALLEHEAQQGRRPTPMQLTRLANGLHAAREVQRNLQAMEAAGAQVLYCVADVSDAPSVAQALERVRKRFGPITCLVHGAGVLADKLIKDKTLDQYDSVMSTKVEGLQHLLTAMAQDPLNAIVMFSSVAARVGNPGQCDYAMANEVLNQVALVEAPRRPGCLVRAIGWGPWDGGMVTPALRAHFDAQGVSLIDADAGAAAFLAELHEGGPEVQLVVGPGEPRELLARDTGHRGALTADVVLGPQRYPFLASHCIGSEPVVPVVLVAEWFMQVAMSLLPGAGLPALRELRVMRGVVLQDWPQQATRLRVSARFEPGTGRRLRCEVHSANGDVLHYSGTADFSAQPALEAAVGSELPLRACDIDGAGLYGTPALFHGPDLQAIQRFTGIGDQGVDAELYGAWGLGWDGGDRLLDLAALDGGLQVAVGWLHRSSGGAMLPTHLGEVLAEPEGSTTDPIRCAVQLRSSNTLQAIVDITLRGGGWSVRMSGVQLHARVAVPADHVNG